MWKRVNCLSDRPLSRAGNEIFLKAVIQAIPAYIMSFFQVPVANCESFRRSLADHWWGRENGKKKMHWRSWEWLTAGKDLGGLGFQDFVVFNQAMLARQCWRLLTEPNSLCARFLKGRYFPNCELLEAPKPHSSSCTWRSILFGMELLKEGIQWGIGNGQRTKLLSDNWIPGIRPFMLSPRIAIPVGATVSFLIDEDQGGWDVDRVRAAFEDVIAEKILQVPISKRGGEDFISWPSTKFGTYTVKSG
ncbi:uncharacterized mitochondrial protein AtMg00310-like [Lolium perenne]|uniref:uncharacterized mitochondrial protein AtMg00310-like n=1 Tax=Lolium perenne TaxID=4522 RepID=UPI0021F67691|nr:uncharacterized mitochondrial protein AtMg00310-like [Lolium perenne]